MIDVGKLVESYTYFRVRDLEGCYVSYELIELQLLLSYI